MASLTSDMILICVANERIPGRRAIQQIKYILLITRGKEPFKDMMALPGGHVDPEETSKEASIRELEEETGIKLSEDSIKRTVKIGSYSDPGRDPRGRYVTEVFRCTIFESKLPELKAGDDANKAQWVKLSEAFRVPLAFDHSRILIDMYNSLNY